MKLSTLFETPLPDDWDKSIYNNHTSFKKKIEYAKEKAKRIGSGSSRVAFEIDYQGRPTILKIAKNRKGFAQNEAESQMFDDYHIKSLDITIPMIDYDETSSMPTWIHVEKAKKFKKSDFKKYFSLEYDKFYLFIKWSNEPKYFSNVVSYKQDIKEIENALEKNQSLYNLYLLITNYDIPTDDLTRKNNWGIYKNRPVIIDFGLTWDVVKLYYT